MWRYLVVLPVLFAWFFHNQPLKRNFSPHALKFSGSVLEETLFLPSQIYTLKSIAVQRNVLHIAGFTRFHLLHFMLSSKVPAESRHFKRCRQRTSAYLVGQTERISFLSFSSLVELGYFSFLCSWEDHKSFREFIHLGKVSNPLILLRTKGSVWI